MKFVVFTLGCKVNKYESDAMMRKLSDNGFDVSDRLEPADAYIINTCTVTAEADKKSRQAVSRVLKSNPDARVYIMGCSSQRDLMQYADKPNVSLITGTASKSAMLENIMAGISPLNYPPSLMAPLPTVYEQEPFPFPSRTRSLLKVQDGCNNFCSYCIIPYVRGRSRSRGLDSIADEARRLAIETKEIVLTGINLSAYGKDTGSSLAELVRSLSDINVRKRLGSLECEVIDDELLSAMRDGGFCEHFHLSLQSGCDAVLKAMNRHYDTHYYLGKVELIRKYFPNAGITTDIICGFPTETEENHRESLAFVEQVGFSDAHVFPYSKRDGTPAARLAQIKNSVKQRRASEMSAVTEKSKTAFLSAQCGKVYPVYLEEKDGDFYVGYTPNYIKVYTSSDGVKRIINLRMGEIYKEGVKGNE